MISLIVAYGKNNKVIGIITLGDLCANQNVHHCATDYIQFFLKA